MACETEAAAQRKAAGEYQKALRAFSDAVNQHGDLVYALTIVLSAHEAYLEAARAWRDCASKAPSEKKTAAMDALDAHAQSLEAELGVLKQWVSA